MLGRPSAIGQEQTYELNPADNFIWPFSKQKEKRTLKFEAMFLPDAAPVTSDKAVAVLEPYLASLLVKWGGTSFNRGIYRLLRSDEMATWTAIAESAFPKLAGRLLPFGFDWLGRMFTLDRQRFIDGFPAVTLLEPGTGDVLEIPCNAESFHEVELINYREAALAESFFYSWLSSGGSPPTTMQCVAYRQPLFLGGADIVPNLELTDLRVYWVIAEQLLQQTRELSVGTVINEIRIE